MIHKHNNEVLSRLFCISQCSECESLVLVSQKSSLEVPWSLYLQPQNHLDSNVFTENSLTNKMMTNVNIPSSIMIFVNVLSSMMIFVILC